MAKVNQLLALKEPEDFTRSDLRQWRDMIRAEVIASITGQYAESPFRWLADLDPKWIDNALQDALSDATHDAWLKMEEE